LFRLLSELPIIDSRLTRAIEGYDTSQQNMLWRAALSIISDENIRVRNYAKTIAEN
jgi:hypothetical protein